MIRAAAVLAMPRASGPRRAMIASLTCRGCVPAGCRWIASTRAQREPHPAALLGHVPADHPGVGFVSAAGQPSPAGQLSGLAVPGDVADLPRRSTAPSTGPMPEQSPDCGISPVTSQHPGGLLLQPGDLAVQHGDQRAQRGQPAGVRLRSRLGLSWANGVRLGCCPQVKRALPTLSGGCRSGSAARLRPGGLASGSSGGRLRRWRG